MVAIIDIDCKALAGFDEVDEKALESLANLLADSCDWKQDAKSSRSGKLDAY